MHLWLKLLNLSLMVSLAGAGDSSLTVSHRARSLQPGEVVLVRAEAQAPLKSLHGRAFKKRFLFYPTVDPTVWEGLIGIDLTTKPGKHQLVLEASTGTDETLKASYDLEVQDKSFPTRRLTVAAKFVNPPEDALPRIREESRRVGRIFAAVSPEKNWQGSFGLPVPGAPTSGFGKRSILNNQPRSPHSGTDFDADEGTPVRAPNRGRVVLASNLYYSGNTVILDHGHGLYSYFGHLSRFAVTEGAEVSPEEVIGHVGATGRVTGPHLHWSVRLSGTRVDPESLIAVLEEAEADTTGSAR